MKQLIVMVSAIMLGLYIFNLIIGPKEGSVLSVVRQVWLQEIEARTMEELPQETQ